MAWDRQHRWFQLLIGALASFFMLLLMALLISAGHYDRTKMIAQQARGWFQHAQS
jgi:hypothetical protein